jgi:thiosulfate reductase/polysulfide reductase chain A
MGEKTSVYSLCGMCAVRCPIRVEIQDGRVIWIEGNPHAAGIEGSLCAKGSAGLAFEYDAERPQHPMIRSGPRGSGQWQKASWSEALDFISEKLRAVTARHGSRAIALADRGGLFTDLTKSFIKALGSPNYFDHDDACASNVNLACKSLFGFGRGEMIYDFGKAKHIVLYGRNVFESLQVKEVNSILDALDRGAKLTYVDIRATVTASKADRFLMVRPGTDYALNLGLIHLILKEGLYDKSFVDRYVSGFPELERFVAPCTPEWAAGQTGLAAQDIIALAREAAAARPRTIFHGGWMSARYPDSFYSCRSAYILNVLMGNCEVEGGLILAKGARDAGAKPLNSLGAKIPAPAERIVDGVDLPSKPLGTGHVMSLYKAIGKGEPYPIRAFFAYRYDPLASLPDPDAQKKILDRLDLLVSIDVNYSDTAWYSDVILPEATYLERSNIIAEQKGPTPTLAMRRQAIAPRFDSKPAWEIFCLLADKMGIGQYFPFRSIEEIWKYQLEGTGISVEDFAAKGFVKLAPKPILKDRAQLVFKTPSGKIELVSAEMARASFESLKPFVPPCKPLEGSFRLAFGRSAAHTHAQSQNNPYLHEIVSQNSLWINEEAARRLGIADSEEVEVVAADGYVGRIKAKLTSLIHPEAVFMLHGFGNETPRKTRSFRCGLKDTRFTAGALERTDPVGGCVAFLECTVTVRKSGAQAPSSPSSH